MGTGSKTEETRADVLARSAITIDVLRDELGISVPDLADRIERDRTHLWRILNGQAALTADIFSRSLRELANVIEYRAAAGEPIHG